MINLIHAKAIAEDLAEEGAAQAKRLKRGKNYRTTQQRGADTIINMMRVLHRERRTKCYWRLAFYVFLSAYVAGFLLAKW